MNATSAIGVLRQFEETDVVMKFWNGWIIRWVPRFGGLCAIRQTPLGSLADPQVFTLPPDIPVEEAFPVSEPMARRPCTIFM